MLAFRPLPPKYTAGFELQSIWIYVRDHRRRELAIAERTCEAHYGSFVLGQSWREPAEARRLALDVAYGPQPIVALIIGHAHACTSSVLNHRRTTSMVAARRS